MVPASRRNSPVTKIADVPNLLFNHDLLGGPRATQQGRQPCPVMASALPIERWTKEAGSPYMKSAGIYKRQAC